VPDSDDKTSSAPRVSRGRSQRRPQSQPRSQEPDRILPSSERLQQQNTSESLMALRSKLPGGSNGKYPSEGSQKLQTTTSANNRWRSSSTTPISPTKSKGTASSTRVPLPPERVMLRTANKPARGSMAPLISGLRLLIFGIGIGAIAGTLLSVLDPTTRIPSTSTTVPQQKIQPKTAATVVLPPQSGLKLSQEVKPLKTILQQLAAKNAGLLPGVFFVDLDTGAYVDLNGASTFAAASMIKFPIVVAFFQDVDAGKIRLNEMLSVEPKLIGEGSGDMQYQPVGTKFTALETATKMITISDNTATNMLIARMGGATALNQRFRNWGLTATQIRNLLPDLSGTNTTSPRDLANLTALVNQGDLMSLRSRDRLLDIMRRTTINTLLPPGLGPGATIAHKTGDIGTLVGDVGIVDMPTGKRYIAVTMVKRPHNDSRAQELIRQISHAVYEQFSQAPVVVPPNASR